ncbi:MAG: histidine kinase [Burkholderiaceae bacterium]|nr:histidine kinase [Burkholderiaceae bacterium]
MNVAAHEAPSSGFHFRSARATIGAGWNAIVSIRSAEWTWALLIALFGILVQCALMLGESKPSIPTLDLIPVFEQAVISWITQVCLGLCAWAIVDRSAVPTERRAAWLAIALVIAVLAQVALVSALSDLMIGRIDPCVFYECDHKDMSKVPSWLMYSEASGRMLILGSLAFAWLEARRRNCEIERRLLASQQERASLQRSALDARLTAMRAQVDPQFLFESLADVQALYGTDAARGAAALDSLIVYLRTALPRLRTEGSTIGAEAALLDSWLAVLAARRNGVPARSIEIEPDCAGAPFPATVLLPLVQWAVGDGARPASQVRLQVGKLSGEGAGALTARLQVQPGRACSADETQPQRLRERLQAIYGEAAVLNCECVPAVNSAADASGDMVTVCWPDERAERDRR